MHVGDRDALRTCRCRDNNYRLPQKTKHFAGKMYSTIYTVSWKKNSPPKQNAVKCTVYNTIQ